MRAFFLVILAFMPLSVLADMQLAREKNCLACHAIEQKLVGPAFRDVASKYRGDRNAESRLIAKVMRGGSGVWGPIPMPANPQVSEVETRVLVQWILSPSFPRAVPRTESKSQLPTSHQESISIDSAKIKCSELGFTPDTEKFGSCVLQLSK